MTTRTDVENLKTSGAEKLLAVVLAVFLLIGAVWTYENIDDAIGGDESGYYGNVYRDQDPIDAQAVRTENQARSGVYKAERQVRTATREVEFTREAYRTELETGSGATAATLTDYRNAQAKLEVQEKELAAAKDEAAAAQPAANVARQHISELRQTAAGDTRNDDRIVFALRLILVLGMLGIGYWVLGQVRHRRSRLLPLVLAEIGAAAALAFFMAGDYLWDLEVFSDLGPLAISFAGVALTIVAFIALQRYLAKLIPQRRVRRHECPFCGYPARDNSMCEGCGRRVKGDCSTCHEPRRVGTAHCGACGRA